jgi:hypothetical protein
MSFVQPISKAYLIDLFLKFQHLLILISFMVNYLIYIKIFLTLSNFMHKIHKFLQLNLDH